MRCVVCLREIIIPASVHNVIIINMKGNWNGKYVSMRRWKFLELKSWVGIREYTKLKYNDGNISA
jgi:hypothetical protein